jgi:diaminopimelate epimerase
MATDAPTTLRLTKHEGAGNDFLVLVDVEGRVALAPDEIRNLCDRRRGVGADGVIRLGRGSDGAEISMELHNADGGLAETSGNGLRCAAQAAVDAGLVRPPSFRLRTGAGVSTVDYEGLASSGSARATVSMGPVRLVGEPRADPAGRPARVVDVGNPHIVVRCEDPAEIDLAAMAEKLAAEFDEGINVEYVAPGPGVDELTMRVFERGVGETWACGSGSCAAAAAARAWGLVGRQVAVRNPGGTLEVVLGHRAADPVLLGGPVRRVAEVVVDRSVLQ